MNYFSRFNFKTLILSMLFIGTVFSIGFVAHAAEIGINTPSSTIAQHELVQADIVINTENQVINTISGILSYNPAILDVAHINTGNSLISFWVTEPTVGDTYGTIEFSGIIPGGINTDHGYLFSVIFAGITTGDGGLRIDRPQVLANDGNGTAIPTTVRLSNLAVSDATITPTTYQIDDTLAPEKFSITRTRDQNIFEGRQFIVFHASDKGAGIASYRICEITWHPCVNGNSPYQLRNQTGFFFIMVTAHDGMHNTRSTYIMSWKLETLLVIIILSGILLSYGVHRKKNRSHVS